MSDRFTIRFPVRFRDLDALGHVNHAVYFTYMESARTEYWRRLFRSENLKEVSFIIAHAECDYKTAARYGDEIEVSLWTSEVKNSSFAWDYEIRNAKTSELIALGNTVQVYYNYSTQKSMPIPPEVRARLLS